MLDMEMEKRCQSRNNDTSESENQQGGWIEASEQDKGILAILEIQRQTLLSSRERIEQKAQHMFVVTNAVASIAVASHFAVVPTDRLEQYMVAFIIVFGLLYLTIAHKLLYGCLSQVV